MNFILAILKCFIAYFTESLGAPFSRHTSQTSFPIVVEVIIGAAFLGRALGFSSGFEASDNLGLLLFRFSRFSTFAGGSGGISFVSVGT